MPESWRMHEDRYLECALVSKKQYDELTDRQITARELELAKIAALFAY